jgi:hypothetical protein
MRPFRIFLVIVVVLAFIIGFLRSLPNLLNPQYFGLQHKSARWYADFTGACDRVIAGHPLGTNEYIRVSVTDPSLPKIITDMNPIKITVSHQRFWMLLGSDSHEGFGLTWDPDWHDPSIWNLHTTAESLDTVVYSARRIVPPDATLESTPAAH